MRKKIKRPHKVQQKMHFKTPFDTKLNFFNPSLIISLDMLRAVEMILTVK